MANKNIPTIQTIRGNVGIGTTDPSSKLQVSGEAYVTGAFGQGVSIANKITNYGAEFRTSGASAQVFFGRSGNNIGSGAIGADASYVFRVWKPTDFSTPFVIEQGGNVGIGTTSPGAKLHAASTTSDFVAKFSHSIGTGYAPGSILLEAEQSTSRGQGIFHYNNVADENWFTGVPYNVSSKKWIVANKSSTTQDVATAQLQHALLTIDSDTGNVGIGTTSPGAKLNVVSNGVIAKFKSTNTGTSGFAEVFYENDAGNKLIVGSIGSGYTNSTWAGARYMYATDGDLMIKTLGSGTNLRFYTAGAANERMRITSSGNVGIGTADLTTPGFGSAPKLSVSDTSGGVLQLSNLTLDTPAGSVIGNIQFANSDGTPNDYVGASIQAISKTTPSAASSGGMHLDFLTSTGVTGASPQTRMRIDNNGNVGIGTTSPTDYKLDVVNTNDGATGIGPFRVSAQANAGTVAVFENTVGINTSLKISDTVDDMYVVSRNGIMGLGPSGGWSSTNINISSAGNVGIGDRNPSTNHKLTVKRNGGYGIKVDGTQIGFYQGTTFRGSIGPQIDSSLFDINGQSSIRFKINNSLVGRWNSGGYFGIGTQDPDFPLDINRSDAKARIWSTSGNAPALVLKGGNGQILFEDASGTTDFLMLNRGNNFAFKKSSAGQEYIYITTSGSSDGNIGIGSNFDQQNLPSAKLEVDGNILATGDVVAYYSSDERLKDNIKPIENALDKVESIGGYTFDWNDKQSTYEGSDIGVIAQEIEAIAPELVTERETGYKAVKYDKLVAVLIESIKELSAKVKTLESKLQ